MSLSNYPSPDLEENPYQKKFWEAVQDEKLLIQRCNVCDQYQFPPASGCRTCGNLDLTWDESEGRGKIYSYTIVRRTVKWPAFESDCPYPLIWVDIEENIRIFSQLTDFVLENIYINQPVVIDFKPLHHSSFLFPVFVPSD